MTSNPVILNKMDDFSWLVATVGMVLALGITRMLASGVALFRSRRRATLDWLPIVWALCILYSMLEFSYMLHRMTGMVQVKTFAGCMMVLSFAVVLFLAGALILPAQELPEGGSLRAEFAEDGRWALTFLALYDFLCLYVNWLLLKVSPFVLNNALNVVLAALALVAMWAALRKVKAGATVLYAAIVVAVAILFD